MRVGGGAGLFGPTQAYRYPSNCDQPCRALAGRSGHILDAVELVRCPFEPREARCVVIGLGEQDSGFFQQDAQEPVQLADMVGHQAILNAARPGAGNVIPDRVLRYELASGDERRIGAR